MSHQTGRRVNIGEGGREGGCGPGVGGEVTGGWTTTCLCCETGFKRQQKVACGREFVSLDRRA